MSELHTIHPLSGVVPLPCLDLWALPGTQTSILKGEYHEYRPFTALSAKGDQPIHFIIDNNYDEYFDFGESYLSVRARVFLTKDDKSDPDEALWKEVFPCNYLIHSMFKQAEVFIGNKPITMAPQTYHYNSYFQGLMAYSDDAKNSIMGASGWFEDPRKLNEMIMPTSRKGNRGAEFELLGKLHLDLAFQEKLIVGGVQIRIKLSPEDPKFIFKSKDGTNVRIDIDEATFYAYKHIVSQNLMEAHMKALNISPCRYAFVRSEVKVLQISQNQIDSIQDNIIVGQLPRRMFVAMIKADAFNGTFKEDPYYFDHFNLSFLAVYINGVQHPSKPYTPNFNNGSYTREYLMLMSVLNQNNTDPYLRLTKEEYGTKGFTIFAFNFSNDRSSGPCIDSHCNPLAYGQMRLHLKFGSALKSPINVLLFCEFDSMIQIDQHRNVSTSFN